jgi:AcrR family transcriptional regulator
MVRKTTTVADVDTDVPPLTRFPLREERARRTHASLVAAAGEVFAEVGYVAATIEVIAARAGVARPTVFTSVPGGKSQLLKEARDRALAGDDLDVPVRHRRWLVDALGQEDPRELLRLQARNYRVMLGRAAVLEEVLAQAASSDPTLGELRAEAERQRSVGTRIVARAVAGRGALRPGLSEARAADAIYALASPQVYLLLVRDRGWSPTAYQSWLREQLVSALLPPG